MASILEFLEFDDQFDLGFQIGTLEDVIQFNETIDPHSYFAAMTDGIYLVDVVKPNAVVSGSIADTIVFDEYILHVPPQTFEDFLILADYLDTPNGVLVDTLELDDEMDVIPGLGIADTLTLQDSISYLAISNSPLTDALSLTDGFPAYLNNRWTPIVPIPEERT